MAAILEGAKKMPTLALDSRSRRLRVHVLLGLRFRGPHTVSLRARRDEMPHEIWIAIGFAGLGTVIGVAMTFNTLTGVCN